MHLKFHKASVGDPWQPLINLHFAYKDSNRHLCLWIYFTNNCSKVLSSRLIEGRVLRRAKSSKISLSSLTLGFRAQSFLARSLEATTQKSLANANLCQIFHLLVTFFASMVEWSWISPSAVGLGPQSDTYLKEYLSQNVWSSPLGKWAQRCITIISSPSVFRA